LAFLFKVIVTMYGTMNLKFYSAFPSACRCDYSPLSLKKRD